MNDDLPTPSPSPDPDESFEGKLKATSERIKRYGFFYDALSPREQKLYLLTQIDPGMEAHIAVLRKNMTSSWPSIRMISRPSISQ